MDYKENYDLWINSSFIDESMKNELKNITEEDKKDRFYKDLEFGTGGLRGIIGAGSNRINIYTVAKATEGFSRYLKSKYKDNISVAIAYDSRNMSFQFAEIAANLLVNNNIKVFLFDKLTPTPILSYAVRYLKCNGGIVITASHNPKEYNGYKVYDDRGVQVTDDIAKEILININSIKDFDEINLNITNEQLKKKNLRYIGEEIYSTYLEKVKELSLRKELVIKNSEKLNIIYTPLHGTGNLPIRKLLSDLNYKNLFIVKDQENPDINFSTVDYPNPEDPKVFDLALKMAKERDIDIILGTDPDCDRIGVMVKNCNGDFNILTGNQVGVLLSYYILDTLKEKNKMPNNGMILKTIVTTDMIKEFKKDFNFNIFEVLTGFKYIGEFIEKEKDKKFILGFEESYGYLAGDFVRDKDAVIATMLICEMALYYKLKGLTLQDVLKNLYNKYGYFKEELITFELKGQSGKDKIDKIINNFRENSREIFKEFKLETIEDYKIGKINSLIIEKEREINLPKSNVIKFIFKDNSWVVIRPSGTEPKIKIYISVKGKSQKECDTILEKLKSLIALQINSI